MRELPRIRRFVLIATLAAATIAPAAAVASEIGVPALNGTFAGGAGGWTSTSSCAPLCSVTNTVDPGPGASGPGSAAVIYTTLGGLLGGLASGTSTWTSPSFTWTHATPDSATVSYARKATIGGLLVAGGTASTRIQLRDLTSGAITTIASGGIASAVSGFGTHVLAIDPALLEQAHSYRLVFTTNLAAAALLSGILVAYDDIAMTATITPGGTSGGSPGPDIPGGSGGTGGTGGSEPGTGAATAGPASARLRILAPRMVRGALGRTVTLRVRVTRAGKAVRKAVVTWRTSSATRRVVTDDHGYATIRLIRRSRAPLRITLRSGAATATTWMRAAAA